MVALRHRQRRSVAWLVAIAVLLHGWLPIFLQVSLLSAEASAHSDDRVHAHSHADHAARPVQPPPEPGPADNGSECPLLGSGVCLCAALVKVLPAPAIDAPLAAAIARRARGRFPAFRVRRRLRAAPFEARAPPLSG